jgi:hypothetical protein
MTLTSSGYAGTRGETGAREITTGEPAMLPVPSCRGGCFPYGGSDAHFAEAAEVSLPRQTIWDTDR